MGLDMVRYGKQGGKVLGVWYGSASDRSQEPLKGEGRDE